MRNLVNLAFFVFLVSLVGCAGSSRNLPPVQSQAAPQSLYADSKVPRALWGINPAEIRPVSDEEAGKIGRKKN
jgi:hypothetical protein